MTGITQRIISHATVCYNTIPARVEPKLELKPNAGQVPSTVLSAPSPLSFSMRVRHLASESHSELLRLRRACILTTVAAIRRIRVNILMKYVQYIKNSPISVLYIAYFLNLHILYIDPFSLFD